MDKLRQRLTSINTKQRFGEVLALVLIAGLMGLLVYFLIPTHTATPKVAPVTVRSNASFAVQERAATPTYQAPVTNGNVPQASDIASNSTHQSTAPVQSAADNMAHVGTDTHAVPAPQLAKVVHGTQASTSSGCAGVTKPLDATLSRVGSTLHLTSIVSSLVADTSSCQS